MTSLKGIFVAYGIYFSIKTENIGLDNLPIAVN
jgi:hypothetical protein